MMTRYGIAVGVFVGTALGWSVWSSTADGAAPTACSSQTACRGAPSRTPARAVAATYARQSSEEEFVVEEPEFFEGDWAYDEGCWMDPCAVSACYPIGGGLWFGMDFLLWWRNSREFPDLLTGFPGPSGSPVLFGGSVDESARPGGRMEFGLWLDPWQRTAVGFRYAAMADATISPEYTSGDVSFLARPFLDVSTTPATPTAFPVFNALAPTTGSLALRSDSSFQAGDVFFLWTLRRSHCASFGFLAGYQVARIDESLAIDSWTQSGPESLEVSDLFDARNEFHGGLFGLRGEYRCGQFGIELLGRFGFGNMRQNILIAGSTTSTDAGGGTSIRDSGLLAQAATNGGQHEQDKFSYTNEAGVKLAFYPMEHLKLSLGYTLMYWSSVVRPGHEIDTAIDGRLLTAFPPDNATRPAFAFNPTDYLVHGLTFGAELRF